MSVFVCLCVVHIHADIAQSRYRIEQCSIVALDLSVVYVEACRVA